MLVEGITPLEEVDMGKGTSGSSGGKGTMSGGSGMTKRGGVGGLKQAYASVHSRLAEIGFVAVEPGILLWPNPMGDARVSGWLGLNHGRVARGTYAINPVVGVYVEQVERIISRLFSEEHRRGTPASLSSPLSALMPRSEYREWIVSDAGENDATSVGIRDAVVAYGVSFIKEYADLDRFVAGLRAGVGWPHQAPYRIAVGLRVSGKEQEARKYAEATLAELASATSPYAEELRGFLHKFLASGLGDA